MTSGIDIIEHADALIWITNHKATINIDDFIRQACKKITIGAGTLTIKIDCKKASVFLNQVLKLSLPAPHEELVHEITSAWRLSRSKSGAIRIDARQEHLEKDAPFNRPGHEIQKWVKGIVWREQHFKGKSISDIARAENTDRRYVARIITQSLEIG